MIINGGIVTYNPDIEKLKKNIKSHCRTGL